jgi:alpha-methylacyl-CoA racemase
MNLKPMAGLRVVSMAVNLPGPLTAARYIDLGASVTKVVPPTGDPLAWVSPAWHEDLQAGQAVITLDLKTEAGRSGLDELLGSADIFLTATRPAGLARLGYAPEDIAARYPRLCHVAIVGYPPPDENRAGHDLTYQASVGLLEPPQFPRIPLADYAGAERAVSATLALLWERERTGQGGCALVSLVEALAPYSHALCYGLLAPGTLLGGASALYHLYQASDGWVALASLEPHFQTKLREGLGVPALTGQALTEAFKTKTASEWDEWAKAHDIPMAGVHDPLCAD